VTAIERPWEVWVVMPCLNEGATLRAAIADVRRFGYSLVVVDDGSTEPVSRDIGDANVHVLRHCVNLGQGAALQTGIDFALRRGATYIVTFDSDGQHVASEIETLLEPLTDGRAAITLGTRFADGGRAINITNTRRRTLKLATKLTRFTTGLELTDTHNGFRGLTRDTAKKLRITQNRMSHASQILEEIARLGIPYLEVPVTIHYTEYSVQKGQKLSNAFNILWESFTQIFT
jgi:glycosyltransferase involved in cell wall biosynthesis